MPALKADLEYFPVVNFAMQQNNFLRYVQKITITNTTNYRIDNVWFTLSFEPQFAENISISNSINKIKTKNLWRLTEPPVVSFLPSKTSTVNSRLLSSTDTNCLAILYIAN